jgi:hypothetical protein
VPSGVASNVVSSAATSETRVAAIHSGVPK